MNRKQIIMGRLLIAVFVIAVSNSDAAAEEYVWARSQWAMGPNRPVSVPNNGYGGYWVPRNQYGNNYEGQRITNPTGMVVLANQPQPTQQTFRPRIFRRR